MILQWDRSDWWSCKTIYSDFRKNKINLLINILLYINASSLALCLLSCCFEVRSDYTVIWQVDAAGEGMHLYTAPLTVLVSRPQPSCPGHARVMTTFTCWSICLHWFCLCQSLRTCSTTACKLSAHCVFLWHMWVFFIYFQINTDAYECVPSWMLVALFRADRFLEMFPMSLTSCFQSERSVSGINQQQSGSEGCKISLVYSLVAFIVTLSHKNEVMLMPVSCRWDTNLHTPFHTKCYRRHQHNLLIISSHRHHYNIIRIRQEVYIRKFHKINNSALLQVYSKVPMVCICHRHAKYTRNRLGPSGGPSRPAGLLCWP